MPDPLSDALNGDLRWWVLDYFPAGLFGSVMGLAGLSAAWRIAHSAYGAPLWPSAAIAVIAVVAFICVSAAYLLKAVVVPRSVFAELRHPVSGSLFGTLFVSLLLLPIDIAGYSLTLAQALWWSGASGMVIFAFVVIGRWLGNRQHVAHATPAWIVPVIGLLDLPLAMPGLGLGDHREIMIFALAVGLFFTVPIFTLIFARLVFEDEMPEEIRPTLLILVAPFAVGYSTYGAVAGTNDLFSHSLYMMAMFLFVVMMAQLRRIPRVRFRMIWWATSFPLAAVAIAALNFSIANPTAPARAVAWALLALSTVAILTLVVLTINVIAKGQLRLAST